MEKCKFSKRLNYYLEGELSKAESVIIDNHLLNCPICQNILAELQNENKIINDFLINYQEIPITDKLKDRIIFSTKKIHPNRKYLKIITDFSVAASLILSFSLGIMITKSILENDSDINFSSESLVEIDEIYSYFGE